LVHPDTSSIPANAAAKVVGKILRLIAGLIFIHILDEIH